MIQTGVVWYNNETRGWKLDVGEGFRSFTGEPVRFEQRFSAPPSIALALAGLNSANATNLRVGLIPLEVLPDEFKIEVKTWQDTRLYGVEVSWIAFD
jgi:H-type lectin domain